MDGLFSLVFCSFRGFTVNVRGFVLIFLFKGKCMEIFVCLPKQRLLDLVVGKRFAFCKCM